MQQGLSAETLGVDGGRSAHVECDPRFPPASEDEDATKLRG